MAGAPTEDPFYNRDTIALLKQKPEEGPWAGRLAKLRLLKAEIQEGLEPGAPPPALLGQIDTALDRIAAGLYHLCARCGRRIPETRERVEGPWIVTCPTCKERKA